jgi:hypothetical protein
MGSHHHQSTLLSLTYSRLCISHRTDPVFANVTKKEIAAREGRREWMVRPTIAEVTKRFQFTCCQTTMGVYIIHIFDSSKTL